LVLSVLAGGAYEYRKATTRAEPISTDWPRQEEKVVFSTLDFCRQKGALNSACDWSLMGQSPGRNSPVEETILGCKQMRAGESFIGKRTGKRYLAAGAGKHSSAMSD
jgi:hypothetical protein